MKRIIFLLLIFISTTNIAAQTGIGTTTPKATLDIQGKPSETTTVDGLMAPKISRAQLIAKTGYTAAQTGAIVFVTDLSGVTNAATANITQAGYYYYNGSTWNSMNSGAITETDPTYSTNFNLTGAATGDMLQFNGTNWVAKKTGAVSVISKLADTPTTFATIGDYQFR